MEENRREFERFDLELPAQVKANNDLGDTSEVMSFLTKDICAGGAYLVGPENLPEGTKIDLHLELNLEQLKKIKNKRASIQVKGTVIRKNGDNGLAIRFDKNYRIIPI